MKSNAIILCAGLGLWLSLPMQGAVPNPVLKLTLDNNLTDSSGTVPAHNGTFQGGATFSNDAPVPSAGNTSVFLNGTNTPGAYVLVANPGDFNLDTGSPFTFSAWIKKNYDREDQHVIFGKSPPDVVEGDPKTSALYIDADNHLVWDVWYSGAAISQGTIPKGKWTHAAVTYDGDTFLFYINGAPAGEGDLPFTDQMSSTWPTPWQVTIGATANLLFPGGEVENPGGIFKGNIDNVMFWDSALSGAEMYDVFTSVGEMVLITENPFDQNAAIGGTATFHVGASLIGAPVATQMRYQWQTNGVDIPGATSASYTTPNLTTNDSGMTYRCVVSADGALSQESDPAVVNVLEPLLPAAPTAWLNFDNTLRDQAGMTIAHDGTLHNPNARAAMTNDVVGASAGTASLFLPGDGSYVDLANPTNLNVNAGHPFTVATWIKTTSNGVVFAKSTTAWTPGGDGTHTTALYLDDAGKLVYDVYWQGAVSSPMSVNNGQWTHIAVACNGSTYKLYINGSLAGSAAFGGGNEGANGEGAWHYTIGNTMNTDYPKPNGMDGAFEGLIDEMAFWGEELSAAKILSVIKQGIPKAAIAITQQPADRLMRAGEQATFTVAATVVGTSSPLTWQWQQSGSDIPGATNSTYTTPALTVAENGKRYHCVLSAGPVSNTSQDAILTVLDTTSGYLQAVMADKPLVYYRFEEAGGAKTYDATTNAFHGTYANVGHAASASGALGNAASFNGKTASIAVPALNVDGAGTTYSQVTVEAWVKPNSFETPEGFACLYDHDGWFGGVLHNQLIPESGWQVSIASCDPEDQDVGNAAQPGLLTTNQWYHLVAVYDADANSLIRYVNGQLVANATYSSTVPVDLGAAHIGAWNGGSRYYNGLIDELAIYGKALSADRVAAHYKAAAIPVVGPAISFTLAAGQLTLSWSGQGFALQQNSDLNKPGGWTDVPAGGTSPVPINLTSGNQFFRLRKP